MYFLTQIKWNNVLLTCHTRPRITVRAPVVNATQSGVLRTPGPGKATQESRCSEEEGDKASAPPRLRTTATAHEQWKILQNYCACIRLPKRTAPHGRKTHYAEEPGDEGRNHSSASCLGRRHGAVIKGKR